MRITVGTYNLGTAAWASPANTLTIAGLPGIDLDIQNLSTIYNTTRSLGLNIQNSAVASTVIAPTTGAESTVFTFTNPPASFQTGDTLVVVLEVPLAVAQYLLDLYIASL